MGKQVSVSLLFWVLLLCFVAIGCGSGAVGASPGDSAKTLNSISVTPNAENLTVGATQQLTVTGTYSDGSQANVTSSATWSSLNASVASINTNGLLTAVTAGTAAITIDVGSVSTTASVTVNAAQKR